MSPEEDKALARKARANSSKKTQSKSAKPTSAATGQREHGAKRPADDTSNPVQPAKKQKGAKPKFIPPPKNPSQVSSNWKQLAQSLGSKTTAKNGKPKGKHTADKAQKKKPEIWFDDVDMEVVERETGQKVVKPQTSKEKAAKLVTGSFAGPTKHVAIDCEMVGVGFEGKKSVLARVAIVNAFGHVLYDKFVKPKEFVTDYRTHVSGVTPEALEDAIDFAQVQKDVYELMKDRILVGHSLSNDMKVLMLSHPKHMVRDTSKYREFRRLVKGRTPGLRKLTHDLLQLTIQEGEHSPVEDARCCMALYNKYKDQWEEEMRRRRKEKLTSKKGAK